MEEAIEQVLPERLINIDETHWTLVAGGLLTWARKDRESVQCDIQNDDKEGITAIAAIDSAGNKLPLMALGKEKTPRCLTNLAIPGGIWSDFTESVWTMTTVMYHYFDQQ
jgi:hypothetical protein